MTTGSTDRGRVTVRGWLWVQLLIGWLPVWALYASMIVSVHGGEVVGANRSGSACWGRMGFLPDVAGTAGK